MRSAAVLLERLPILPAPAKPMDRRTFIDAGAGAMGALALTKTSVVHALSPSWVHPPATGPEDLGRYLETFDSGLEAIGHGDLSSFLPGETRTLGDRTPLARGALRAVYLTGMLGDLPIEMQADPRVQDRLWRMAPEVTTTMDAMTAHLDERTSSEWVDLQKTLRRRTNPGMAIAEALTREGAMAGLSRSRRLQTRAMLTHITLRLRSQPPDVVVREYRDKVERVADSDGTDAMARRELAARVGEEAYWQLRGQDPAERQSPRGLRTMGWGLAIAGVGGLIILAGAFEGVFVITVGAVVLLVGLVQLVLSALS
jgi:hypothetical protein